MRRMLARLTLLAAGWAAHCTSASAIRIDTGDVWRLTPQAPPANAEFTDVKSVTGQPFEQPEDEARLNQDEEKSFVEIFGKKSTEEKRYKKLKKKFLKKFHKDEWKKFKWSVMIPAIEARIDKAQGKWQRPVLLTQQQQEQQQKQQQLKSQQLRQQQQQQLLLEQ
ncbi:hypothetical protein Emag_003728 [Eimeria magna]